jgi:hypothetical protein
MIRPSRLVYLKHLKMKFLKECGNLIKLQIYQCLESQNLLKNKMVKELKFGLMVLIILECLVME